MIQTSLGSIGIGTSEELVVVDIETTGIPVSSFIVEIGICKLNFKNGNVTKLFDKTIKEKGISPKVSREWIFSHSDLKYDDVDKSKDIDDYRNEIQKIFDQYFVTAFNKSFDFSFLRNRKFMIYKESYCPMVLLTPIMKLPSSYGSYKFPKVEEAWRYLFPSIDYIEKHRAYDDACHEAQIIYELIKKGWFRIKF